MPGSPPLFHRDPGGENHFLTQKSKNIKVSTEPHCGETPGKSGDYDSLEIHNPWKGTAASCSQQGLGGPGLAS
jgi:hypothetical protein